MDIAVIPARGGSKRIPRKNVRDFFGKPMIAWSIETAFACDLFGRIIVSTDDEFTADVARSYGAEVPFLRPAGLADDLTATLPVIAHAIAASNISSAHVGSVCCIYPCAPFLLASDLIEAKSIAVSTNAAFVYPVAQYPHPIQRAMRMHGDHRMEFLSPESELSRTQDLEPTFHDVGQFYWGKTSAWLGNDRMHSSGIGMQIPQWRVVDIDTPDDWRRAELIFATFLAEKTGRSGAPHG